MAPTFNFDRVWQQVKAYRFHMLCWAVYIAYEVFVVQLFPESRRSFISNYFVFYLLHISFFYIHAYAVLPRVFARPKQVFWRLPLYLAAEIILFTLLLLLEGLAQETIEFTTEGEGLIFDIEGLEFFLVPLLPYLLYSTGYYFLRRYLLQQKQQQKAEKLYLEKQLENMQLRNEVLQAEQSFLRSQINPHLLYNTFSFVSYAAKRKPEEADEAIQSLAAIMRYALEDDVGTGLVALEIELEQVYRLIRLNQLRFSNKLYLDVEADAGAEKALVVPVLLLTLVENMFKHGNLREEDSPATISIQTDSERGVLTIATSNKAACHKATDSAGKGIPNLVRRLALHFDKNYYCHHGIEEGVFRVLIEMPLCVVSGKKENMSCQ